MFAFRLTLQFGLILLLVKLFLIPANAGVIVDTNQRAGWFTVGEIAGTGTPGDTVTVKFSDGSTKSATVQAGGRWSIGLTSNEPSGATVVTESDGEVANITVALGFTPPNNSVQTAFAVLGGSSATVTGQTFTLSGNFTTVDTMVDYNSASLTFGQLGGAIQASLFNVSGTGGAGLLTIGLAGNQAYMVNMLPLWNAPTLTGGVAIPLSLSLAGILSVNGLSSPFSGTATGTDTFFPDSTENINLIFNLNSNFGPVNGSFLAHGTEQLVTPEPSAWSLLTIGGVVLITARRRLNLGALKMRRRMRHRIRAVFAVGFFFCGLIATRSAAAATVTVTPDLIQGTFWEGSGATGTITFTVNNGTAATVELFLIVITPAGSGDAFLDKVDFGPSDASNCRNNSSRLAPGASCTIISPYTVLDKDPNDTMNPVDDTGVFTDHVDVAYGPVGGPVTAHAVSAPDSVITVSDVPEPSTLLLCTCGMLGLVSGMRRR